MRSSSFLWVLFCFFVCVLCGYSAVTSFINHHYFLCLFNAVFFALNARTVVQYFREYFRSSKG